MIVFYADDHHILSICEQVMRKYGKTDQTIVHCMFVGPPGVGKSSLLKRLLRMKLDPTRTSTPLAEKSVRVDIMRDVSLSVAQMSSFDWQVIEDPMTQASGLLGHLSTQLEDQFSEQTEQVLKPQESSPNPTLTTSPEAEKSSSSAEEQGHTTSKSPDPETSKLSKTIEFFRRVLKEKGVCIVHVENPCTLYLTDSGGQPEFQELLPALVAGPCIFIVVFPLHKDLNTEYEVEYERPNENKHIRQYKSSLTIKEDIMRSLASITSTKYKNIYGKEVRPRILFVATFKDKVLQEEACQKTLKEVQDFVMKTDAYRHGMIVDASDAQMVFTINNVSDEEAETDAQQIRDAFQKITGCFKVSTPSPWLIFSILVQHVYGKDMQHKHEKHSVIRYNECFKLAQECGIKSSDAFEAALQFLHKQTGVLYYYEKPLELSQIVIRDPQYLLSKVNQLVERTFNFEQTQCAKCTEDFNRGIFKRLDYEMLTEDSSNSLLTSSMFLKLLEHLNVVVPLGDGEKYFMPCAITHIHEVNSSHSKESAIVPPLLITFKSGYCPKGLFGALVACIANKQVSNCMISLEESKIHRDQICFKLGQHTLLLRSNPAYVYIEVTPYSTNNSLSAELCTLCNSVRTFLEGNITKACKTLHYSDSAKYSLSFVCQCSQKEGLHPAESRKGTDEKYFFWCKRSEECAFAKPECYIWLPEVRLL